jgi:hypothetical protein
MANNWSALIGQTIEHVVVCHRPSTPHSQVHLVFTDGTTFEIFSGSGELIGGSSRLYRGNLAEVLSYIHADTLVKVYAALPDD